ncbi:hypothetical protein WYO_0184 [Methylobacterium sp. GXF4]|uniref:hypothetical protein n=1 Tax=Methylobacterium sp. GXF4 TaxID=1096546 RepID=UPI0002698F50|nr:hypothetical protein [Methylobacterium sp. GXF4]EIZ87147.1 hypothetical protein WYO_0184 [Methylobacterium sp. GXF4]
MAATKDYTFTTVPEAGADVDSLLQTVNALRQNVQTLVGQRNTSTPSVTDQVKAAGTSVQRLEKQYTENGQSTAKIIDEVKANADGISAKGKLKFIATAGPQGYYAEYKLALKAGNAVAGFSVLAKRNADGTFSSAISFTANQFQLYDPTLDNGQAVGPTQVFAYMGGVFRFNVPVEVLGEQLEIAGVTNSVLVTDDRDNTPQLEAQITTRNHAQMDIYAQFDGQPDKGYPVSAGTKLLSLERTNPDGSVTLLRNTRVQFFTVRADDGAQIYFSQTHLMFRDTPSPGVNVYRLKMINGEPQGPLILNVIERHR